MTRSRPFIAFEAAASVLLCWLVALVTQLAIFPAVGLQVTLSQQFWNSLALIIAFHLQGGRFLRRFMRLG
ncbi:hypothetical protein N4R57_11910 [Rhodobacteraceae bacterium D3-12]|nr:hypothetical protein N4R57_11910 [Rhodobacteraceae bacterium D3-12]